jgi:hypothetical protein
MADGRYGFDGIIHVFARLGYLPSLSDFHSIGIPIAEGNYGLDLDIGIGLEPIPILSIRLEGREEESVNTPRNGITYVLLGALQALMVIGCASATYPERSDDGLIKVARSRVDALYEEPGVDLRSYRRFAVEECSVTFRDHWLRDQNRDRGPNRRVTDADMSRISQELATSCREILIDELGKIEGCEITTDQGAGVLVLRPAIVDLDIAAPDILSPGRNRTYTTSAGSMRLHLEFVDSSTGTVLGRLIDRQEAAETFRPRQTSGISNMAEAERILGRWALLVREYIQTGAGPVDQIR